jgi:hypothetical protein
MAEASAKFSAAVASGVRPVPVANPVLQFLHFPECGVPICFDMGTKEWLDSCKVIPELVRMPYEICWMEYSVTTDDGTPVVVANLLLARSRKTRQSEQSHEVVHHIFGRAGKDIWDHFGARTLTAQLEPNAGPGSLNCSEKAADIELRRVKAFLSALHCSNVRRHEHTPDAKLQKARAKRGKAPLFSYWTLQLDGKSERGENQGGTHASPRVHLRRGHPRQHAPGKWTWVQPHAVGNKARGVVHKDYSAGPGLTGPQG